MSRYVFIDPKASYRLPKSFNFQEYIHTEREFWALFPETEGKRVNFCQAGLTARVYVEAPEDGSELKPEESYFLMPFGDGTMRPLRMKAERQLTLSEYRMSHLTAMRLAENLQATERIINRIHLEILGPEIIEESRR